MFLLLKGCGDDTASSQQTTGAGTTGQTGEILESIEQFKPDALWSAKGDLRYGDTPMDVDVVRKQQGKDVSFHLIMDGTEMEAERYEVDGQVFALKEAGSETFVPPLPLLKFPLNVGDKWEWGGIMRSADIERKAEATIKTSTDSKQLIVEVELRMESGGPKPAVRTLKFWFERGRGIARREWGQSSTRTSKME